MLLKVGLGSDFLMDKLFNEVEAYLLVWRVDCYLFLLCIKVLLLFGFFYFDIAPLSSFCILEGIEIMKYKIMEIIQYMKTEFKIIWKNKVKINNQYL